MFCRRQAKRAEAANYFSPNQNLHPASTELVTSKNDTIGTKTFTSEWVDWLLNFWDISNVCWLPVFIIPRRLISGNIGRLAQANRPNIQKLPT